MAKDLECVECGSDVHIVKCQSCGAPVCTYCREDEHDCADEDEALDNDSD
jgi:hypothetical protein